MNQHIRRVVIDVIAFFYGSINEKVNVELIIMWKVYTKIIFRL